MGDFGEVDLAGTSLPEGYELVDAHVAGLEEALESFGAGPGAEEFQDLFPGLGFGFGEDAFVVVDAVVDFQDLEVVGFL